MTPPPTPLLVWLDNDFRLADNPALIKAARHGATRLILCVTDTNLPRPRGAASRWWRDQSLLAFDESLQPLGQRLYVHSGDAVEGIVRLCRDQGVAAVFCNAAPDPARAAQQRLVQASLAVPLHTVEGNVLHAPDAVFKGDGTPFQVFTPFSKAADALAVSSPLPPPSALPPPPETLDFPDWKAFQPHWAGGMAQAWTPGEKGAQQRLEDFLNRHLTGYAVQRDYPHEAATSRLSPYLASGDISARTIYHAANALGSGKDRERFIAELYWREFSYHLLWHFPDLHRRNWRASFDRFVWQEDSQALQAWQRGKTGYPIVDAGMRELWHTGWMHNRVRMITASFLVKHLLLPWQAGEAWFWDTLVDADAASNPASWQWVAGSGADAAPYFRIFNPVLQGQKFDPQGGYIRRWCPELAGIPLATLHLPTPAAIVDHTAARARALAAFEGIKGL
ncbi:MAG: cryptochrome/photolyase family protein [Holosporales bacterium]|jgi:deoxyribodipyrimidine photo-lyase